MNSQEAWQKQEKIIEYYKKNEPRLVARNKNRGESETFQEIGMWNIPKNRQSGYLRLFPQDFIVEEGIKNGEIIKINEINNNKIDISKSEKAKTLYAYLIKIGIPTNVAIERISESLQIDKNKIGYAGLKDADAITAQLVAFPKTKLTVQEIKKLKIMNVFLSNFYYNSGSLNAGSLDKNIFTITVRTNGEVDTSILNAKIETIAKFGILNYFQFQRFGGLRLISHKLGKFILQGNYELAIKYFLLKANEYDILLVINLRKEAERVFPDWKKMKEIYTKLPYTFFNELRAVDYLIENSDNYIGALIKIKDQTQLWVYAYASWLFNKYLSMYSRTNGCVDEKFPLLLSNNASDYKIYKEFLIQDKTLNFAKNLYPFKFIQLKKRFIKGRIFPNDIKFEVFNKGAVIKFALQKGSYATTMLTNIFELHQGLPIPDWVNKEEVDPKEMMGEGNIVELRKVFKDSWYSKLEEAI